MVVVNVLQASARGVKFCGWRIADGCGWSTGGIGVLLGLVWLEMDRIYWFRLVLCHPFTRETHLFFQKDTYDWRLCALLQVCSSPVEINRVSSVDCQPSTHKGNPPATCVLHDFSTSFSN